VILVTLGSIQSNPRKGDDSSGKPDRSVAPPRSSLLAIPSIGCNTWIAPTDKGLVMEKLDGEDERDGDEDEDEDEGRTYEDEDGGRKDEEKGESKQKS